MVDNATRDRAADEAAQLLPAHDERRSARRLTVFAGAAVAVSVALVLAVLSGALNAHEFVRLAQWLEQRPDAVLLYGLLYFVLELVAVPATPLTLGSGYLFGVVEGTAVVSVASTAAAAAAFLISRYLLREQVARLAGKFPRFVTIDRAIAREGFKFVFLLRLSPLLPFSISNYLYGLTSVQFFEYFAGSWLGMLPGSVAYVSTGAAFNALTDITDGGAHVSKGLLAVGALATVGVLTMLGRYAAKAVEEEESNDASERV